MASKLVVKLVSWLFCDSGPTSELDCVIAAELHDQGGLLFYRNDSTLLQKLLDFVAVRLTFVLRQENQSKTLDLRKLLPECMYCRVY